MGIIEQNTANNKPDLYALITRELYFTLVSLIYIFFRFATCFIISLVAAPSLCYWDRGNTFGLPFNAQDFPSKVRPWCIAHTVYVIVGFLLGAWLVLKVDPFRIEITSDMDPETAGKARMMDDFTSWGLFTATYSFLPGLFWCTSKLTADIIKQYHMQPQNLAVMPSAERIYGEYKPRQAHKPCRAIGM